MCKGKTLCLKDNICLAGVPLTFGTKALEDYIREWSLSSSLMLQPPSMPS
jgi:Asp-tRNA(Asn)/Glu-tRNA(Gln) amidotransferase A subunit family amidase